jgi:microcompartment protein CcmK/EutM
MLLARVDGNAVSTICHPSLKGFRVLICQPLNEDGEEISEPILAVDALGAGLHQRVLVTTDGPGIRERINQAYSPIRYWTNAVVD